MVGRNSFCQDKQKETRRLGGSQNTFFLGTFCMETQLGRLGSKSWSFISALFRTCGLVCSQKSHLGCFLKHRSKQMEGESFPASPRPSHSFLAWSSIIEVINFTDA